MARLPKPRRDFVVTVEVLKAAGVSFPTLRDWIAKGIIPPPLGAARGRGNLAKYPRQAVLQAELARSDARQPLGFLLLAAMPQQRAHRIHLGVGGAAIAAGALDFFKDCGGRR